MSWQILKLIQGIDLMLNQFGFICSPKHYTIISFFVERVLEKYDQMYEKVTLYNFSNYGGGGSFK